MYNHIEHYNAKKTNNLYKCKQKWSQISLAPLYIQENAPKVILILIVTLKCTIHSNKRSIANEKKNLYPGCVFVRVLDADY